MSEYSGIDSTPFYMKVKDTWMRKSDVLISMHSEKIRVLRVYKNTKLRRFLRWVGFKKVKVNEIKVIVCLK